MSYCAFTSTWKLLTIPLRGDPQVRFLDDVVVDEIGGQSWSSKDDLYKNFSQFLMVGLPTYFDTMFTGIINNS